MNLDGHGVLLMGVEFIAKLLRQHFIDSDVSQECVVLLCECAFVFELVEIALKFVKTNCFGDAGDFQVLDLVFKGAGWVLHEYTYPAVFAG